MNIEFGRTVTGQPEAGAETAAFRTMGKAILGTALAGLLAFTAVPASSEEPAKPIAVDPAAETAETALPSLGRHVRRAARLPFNVSLKFDDEDAADEAKRPNLTRFIRARGHGSEATTVDGYGPDRLVESLTFPSGAPLSEPRGTALADVKDAVGKPGL